jgi:hypothetical protein
MEIFSFVLKVYFAHPSWCAKPTWQCLVSSAEHVLHILVLLLGIFRRAPWPSATSGRPCALLLPRGRPVPLKKLNLNADNTNDRLHGANVMPYWPSYVHDCTFSIGTYLHVAWLASMLPGFTFDDTDSGDWNCEQSMSNTFGNVSC